MATVKAQEDCLLGKLHQVGPGNKVLAKRRVWNIKENHDDGKGSSVAENGGGSPGRASSRLIRNLSSLSLALFYFLNIHHQLP